MPSGSRPKGAVGTRTRPRLRTTTPKPSGRRTSISPGRARRWKQAAYAIARSYGCGALRLWQPAGTRCGKRSRCSSERSSSRPTRARREIWEEIAHANVLYFDGTAFASAMEEAIALADGGESLAALQAELAY